jgi:ABC-type transport system involved in multi-copper enzyme maturation permease subunit
MKPVLLIALNFVREQRWPIFVLLLWVLLLGIFGLVADASRNREDLLFIFKQVAVYVVAFSVFFGSSAIHNERKSRRILAVLSKAVSRSQYLSGLALGITIACAIYCVALGATASWTLSAVGYPVGKVWFLMVCLVAACMLAGTVALMFSTVLSPFLAAAATAVVLGLPGLASHTFAPNWSYLVPVYALTSAVLNTTFRSPGAALWFPVELALLETVFFWLLSARIFSRVDISVAVE